MSLTKVTYSMIDTAPFNVRDYGATGDGATDDTTAIQAAIDAATAAGGGAVFLPAGEYRTTAPIDITFDKIRLEGAQEYASVILSDHTGVAVNLATNNQPYIGHLHIKRSTGQGAIRSRTGTGLRVFGDFAGGSSIQCQVEYVRIDGFARGLDLYACFLSNFSYMTLKWNDISYYFNNNTNDSITFFACQSNTLISQHIVGDGDTAECGATFIACEFEGSDKFPAISAIGGTGFYYQFTDCYLYENNFGSAAGSTFEFFKFDIAGALRINGSGVNCSGKQDARLILGRRNASTVRWQIQIDNCVISSDRVIAPDIDVDVGAVTNDLIYVSPSCVYSNPDNPGCYLTTEENSLYRTGVVFAQNAVRQFWDGRTQFIQGVTNGHQFNAGASLNWENNCLTFAQNNGSQQSWLWVDTTGVLRIKSGTAPASDTDGTVVGTQT